MVHCNGGHSKPHICKWIDRRVVLHFSTTNKQAEGKMSTQVLVIEILRLKFEIIRLQIELLRLAIWVNQG